MQQRDFDAPNLDILRKPRGRSRPFLEDDPSSVEDDPPTGVEYDASVSVMPSDTRRSSSASAVFAFLFVLLAGVGGALAWGYYGDQAMDLIRAWALPGSTSKPTAPPEDFAELRQQLKSIATDLAAVRHTLEEQSAANHDQLTRIQEQIVQQAIALQAAKQELSQKLSSPPPDKPVPPTDKLPPTDKPAQIPRPKPAQHPARISTQDSSKPIQVSPPQSLLPPKQ